MRDRTADLLRAKQALSQLSYSPIFLIPRPMVAAIILAKTRQNVAKHTFVCESHFNAVFVKIGRPEWTRTTDLTLIRGAL